MSTGAQGDFTLPFNLQLDGWRVMTRDTGNILFGLWKSPYANYPPTSSNAMHIGSTGPILTTGSINEDNALAGWATTTGAYGEVLSINVDTVSGIKTVTLSLKYHQY